MWRLKVFIFLFLLKFGDANGNCDARNYRSVENAPEDALIYGITQDCQMFFIRPSQLHLLSTIRVDKRHSFCYVNLVQLHVKSHDTLLLTFKQATNRICTLEVHIPALNMLFGDHLFRYSLLNSLPYASCSYSKDQTFQLEPDLSFMDPVYSDVIYFIDALSSGKQWKVHQFLLKDTGNMNMMNNLTVTLQTRDSSANEFVVSLDNQRDKLYRRNRFDNLIFQQCAFEMMFRPKESEVNSFETPARGYGAVLNGQSVDGDVMIYVETDRTTDPPTTRLNMLSTSHPEHVSCVSATSFSFDVGIIRESTVEKLKNDPRPPFGTKVSPRPSSKSSKLNEQVNQKLKNSTPASSGKPTIIPTQSSESSVSSSAATSQKPKGAYSPSKSFFSYEFGGAGTTTTTTSVAEEKELISNEIPFPEMSEEEERKQEEELNEIIKELKSDEEENEEKGEEKSEVNQEKEVGELKTREVNRTSENGDKTAESTSSNATSSDAEAVKSSRISMNLNTIVILLSAISFCKYFI
ncbi:hypothetical protein GCK72_013602 [Caenorhabditis remanei]|uniref:Uncharacterized protein n=1 Tax=Caenorhabditis remanei TaxID=31234 RepID=A0A6A5GPP2_CAERE|nr:hypothetical protein GCK72_013602 [Caenorhabditis remanei]KAF1757147.1 hypothetical protein GCK72_013602 [Caenorhabditis remanei]